MEKIDIALACDQRYFPGLLGTIASLLTSASKNYSYTFHILDGGINRESVEILNKLVDSNHDVNFNYLPVSTIEFKEFPAFFYDSKMAYARLLLPSLLNIEKVIYVDTDILVLKDVSELWKIKLDKHAAVCIETIIGALKNECPLYAELNYDGDAPYFNSGLMFINLTKWREDQITEKTFTYIKDYPQYCKFYDQSALNVTLYDKLVWLDSSWNVQAHKEVYNPVRDLDLLRNFSINFHFVTPRKPWLFYSDQPEYQMFYLIYKALAYKLNQPDFLKSKVIFFKRNKIHWILPVYYSSQAFVSRLVNKTKRAEMLKKGAEYWLYAKQVRKGLAKKESELNQLYNVWSTKLQKQLL